jgi:hypothetical protein
VRGGFTRWDRPCAPIDEVRKRVKPTAGQTTADSTQQQQQYARGEGSQMSETGREIASMGGGAAKAGRAQAASLPPPPPARAAPFRDWSAVEGAWIAASPHSSFIKKHPAELQPSYQSHQSWHPTDNLAALEASCCKIESSVTRIRAQFCTRLAS